MAAAGVCCGSLEEPKVLMKMGLSVIIVGHVNFLLGALVHGAVLRNLSLHKQARVKDYAVSNVMTLISGILGVVVGILAIVLSKNKKSKGLVSIPPVWFIRQTWSLFSVSLISALMAASSTIGLFVSVVKAIINGGRSLLSHCRFPDAIGYSSITNECPFDPTRIYSTTLILWMPLIVTCFIQLVFSARCFAACISFLGLPCCPSRRTHYNKAINVVRPIKEASHSRHTEPPKNRVEPSRRHNDISRIQNETVRHNKEPPRRNVKPLRHNTVPSRPQAAPRHLPRHHSSLPLSERQPLRQPDRLRTDVERQQSRTSSRREQEEHQHLRRGTVERSSVWI